MTFQRQSLKPFDSKVAHNFDDLSDFFGRYEKEYLPGFDELKLLNLSNYLVGALLLHYRTNKYSFIFETDPNGVVTRRTPLEAWNTCKKYLLEQFHRKFPKELLRHKFQTLKLSETEGIESFYLTNLYLARLAGITDDSDITLSILSRLPEKLFDLAFVRDVKSTEDLNEFIKWYDVKCQLKEIYYPPSTPSDQVDNSDKTDPTLTTAGTQSTQVNSVSVASSSISLESYNKLNSKYRKACKELQQLRQQLH